MIALVLAALVSQPIATYDASGNLSSYRLRSGDVEIVGFYANGSMSFDEEFGTSGDCLTSGGSGSTPLWQTCVIGTAYQQVQDESVSLPERGAINFLGAGITCVDDTVRTNCTVSGGGGGGISGPGSSTDNAITRWDGTGGTAVQNSTLLVDDSGYIGRTAASGTDQAGSDFRASAGAGTGAGTPGVAYLSTPLALASGTTVQTIVDRFILGGSGTQSTILLGNPDIDNQVTTPMDAQVLATDGNSTNAAGDLLIRAGNAYSNASGGNLTLQSGSTLSAFGFGSSAGDIILECGDASDSNVTDGSLIVRTRATDRLEIAPAGDWLVGGAAGTSGYVLTSNGAGSPPTWQASAGGLGGTAGTTDNALVRADGTGGSTAQGSGVVVDDSARLTLPAAATPSAPSAGNAAVYVRSFAGRPLPSTLAPIGVESWLQPNLATNNVTLWLPGVTTTAGINFGVSWTILATQSHPAQTSTNFLSAMRRAQYQTTTTIGNAAGIRAASNTFWRGNAAGLGGYFFFARVGVATFQSAMQIEVCMRQTAALGGEPSVINNHICLRKDSTDTNWFFSTRDSGAVGTTSVNLGLAVAANQVLDFYVWAGPNASDITYRVERIDSASVLADNVTTSSTLPTNTLFVAPSAQVRTTTANAVAIAVAKLYVESQF